MLVQKIQHTRHFAYPTTTPSRTTADGPVSVVLFVTSLLGRAVAPLGRGRARKEA